MDDHILQARRLILRLGTKRFDPARPEHEAAVNAFDSLEQLEKLLDRLLDVASWQELLAS